jgi:hypothetical protein
MISGWELIEFAGVLYVGGAACSAGGFVPVVQEGPPGPQGPQGPAGTSGPTHVHTQSVASATWTVNHNLGFNPLVQVKTPDGRVPVVEEDHTSNNQTILRMATPITGTARFV